MKHASEDRAAENAAFQQTVADQRTTQALLNKARAELPIDLPRSINHMKYLQNVINVTEMSIKN